MAGTFVNLRAGFAGIVLALLLPVAQAQDATPARTEAGPARDAPVAEAAPAAPALADFIAARSTVDVALAPGGGYVATVQQQDGDAYLVVRDLKAGTRIATKLGKVQLYGLKWLSDDRLIYSAGSTEVGISFDRRGRLRFNGIPRLFAIGRDLKNNRAFFEGDKKVSGLNVITASDISIVPGETQTFIVPLRVGRNLDLARVNAFDGTWTSIARGGETTMAWFVDRTGEPAIRFDTNRRRTELRVLTPEARKGGDIRWKQAFKVRLDKDTEKSEDFSPVAPGPSPELYYVLARPNGADRVGIHLYNIETQTFLQEVFSHPDVDVADGITDPVTGAYVGASYWSDHLEMTFSDRKMQAHYKGLDTFFGKERNIAFIDASADKQVWILGTNGPRDPGTYHVYDMAQAKNEPIGYSNPRLRESQLAKSQPVSYKARDGLVIKGYLTLPPNLAPGVKPPLLVNVHGGPEMRDVAEFDVVTQYLATRGYAVFQPNFRGSSGYGKAFAEAGRRQFGKAMQTDVIDGVAYIAGLGLVDASRACIMGASYGGYAALMGLVQFPELYKCGVSASGPSDLLRQVKWEREEEGSDSEEYKYWVSQIGDPKRDEAEMKAISPINHIADIKAPVMLLHGRLDDTVPYEQSDLMHKAMLKAGKTSTIVEFQGAGHGFEGSDLEAYLKNIEDFLGKHLPLTVAANAPAAN